MGYINMNLRMREKELPESQQEIPIPNFRKVPGNLKNDSGFIGLYRVSFHRWNRIEDWKKNL